MSSLTVQVVTPVQTKFTGSASYVQLPGVLGEMGVLPQHAPLVTMLEPGIVEVSSPEGRLAFAVAAGFATIANDQVVCLVDAAVEASEVDPGKINARITQLEGMLSESENPRLRGELIYCKAQLTLKG